MISRAVTAGNPTSRMASRVALISCERVEGDGGHWINHTYVYTTLQRRLVGRLQGPEGWGQRRIWVWLAPCRDCAAPQTRAMAMRLRVRVWVRRHLGSWR